MVTPTNHVIAWPGFILGEALALWKFSQLFLPDIGEYQKMSHHLSAEPLALCHIMVNLALVIALRP